MAGNGCRHPSLARRRRFSRRGGSERNPARSANPRRPRAEGVISAESDVELFAGPPWFGSARAGSANRAAGGNPLRPEGERGWRRGPFGMGGSSLPGAIPKTGYIRDHRHVALLPPERAPRGPTERRRRRLHADGSLLAALTSPETELVLERRAARCRRSLHRAPLPVTPLSTSPLEAAIPPREQHPFPLEARIARCRAPASGADPARRCGPLIPLRSPDCVAFGRGMCTLHAVLLDRDRRLCVVGSALDFDEKLPLRGVAKRSGRPSPPLRDIDIVADLSFDDGAEHWQ